MSGLRSFLLCLAPAILAYILVLVGKDETIIDAVVLLIVVGSAIAGSCAGFHVYRSMEPEGQATFLKWFTAVVVFLGVAPLYLFLAMAGCCGIAASR
ncbi:MAG TPA: hypothetical protein PLA50_07625 [Bacteroidia bacterium]|nr:hypothetical protein [Bacteroidia bacterium]